MPIEGCEHVRYEWNMLFGLIALQSSVSVKVDDPSLQTIIDNAFVEATAIHLRNVLEWLGARRKERDFHSGIPLDETILAPRRDVLKAWLTQADKQIAHLSRDRTEHKDKKSWDYPEIDRVLGPAYDRLLECDWESAACLRLSHENS